MEKLIAVGVIVEVIKCDESEGVIGRTGKVTELVKNDDVLEKVKVSFRGRPAKNMPVYFGPNDLSIIG